ncbi:MAG: glutamate--tRNA ligase [Patescibacteria group bacterium]|nr:glutamate--tRNA ligase [Patescibacteria group bacterium]
MKLTPAPESPTFQHGDEWQSVWGFRCGVSSPGKGKPRASARGGFTSPRNRKKDLFDFPVRTRFAPSPTGFVHIGNIYGAMLDYAFAKKHKGGFILRIEDTDQKRRVDEAEEKIYQGLKWAGLVPDESPEHGGKYGPYRQSERLEIYQKYARQLVDQGDVYYCFCTPKRLEELRQEQKRKKRLPKYDRLCRKISKKEAEQRIKNGEKYVIRMKVPDNEKIAVNDLLRGKVVFESNLIDDQVLLKADGFPTYHLAVVVDDHLMKISHIIRGEEWLSSAPKHVLLYRYLNWQMPVLIHTANLRNPDRSKMSKRHGHTSLDWYIDQGFLPEALLNFLSLLGWSHPEEKEIFSFDQFVKLFDLKDLSPVGPVFDLKKLEWMNGVYIRNKADADLVEFLKPFLPEVAKDKILTAAPLIKERIKTLKEASEILEFVTRKVDYSPDLLLVKGLTKESAGQMLEKAKAAVDKYGIDVEKLQKEFLKLIKDNNWNTGNFFMVLRTAVCGKKITPPIIESLPLIGKGETLSRLDLALSKLS